MDVVLRTPRLTLRRPVLADAPVVARHLNNFSIAGRLARVPYPYSEADALTWLATCAPGRPDGEVSFAIDLSSEGLVGVVGLLEQAEGKTLGYWLGEPYWNRGFMTEAVEAVVAWFFTQAPHERLRSGAFAFNKASLAVQRKLGFTETGLSSRHCLARHQDLRHIDTLLTRTRWAERMTTRQLQANP